MIRYNLIPHPTPDTKHQQLRRFKVKQHKQKFYKAGVLPTLLHACETWTVYQRHAKRVNHFQTNCLRKPIKIGCQDKIPDTEVLKRQACKVYILFWNWHSNDELGMSPECLTGYEALQVGKRSNGAQKRRYKDTKNHHRPGNRLHKIVQNGVASSEREQTTMKARDSARLIKSAKSAKPEPKDHHQCRHLQNWPALFATDSLEKGLV